MTSWCTAAVRQPWAEALASGDKPVENRVRKDGKQPSLTRHRGPLIIQASAGMSLGEYQGAAGWMRTMTGRIASPRSQLLRGGLLCVMNAVGHVEPNGKIVGSRALDRNIDMRWHARGQWGLVLLDPVWLPFLPIKGQLGPFWLSDETLGTEVAGILHEYAQAHR